MAAAPSGPSRAGLGGGDGGSDRQRGQVCPVTWMLTRAPKPEEWHQQLAGQTRLTVDADEALVVVRAAWTHATDTDPHVGGASGRRQDGEGTTSYQVFEQAVAWMSARDHRRVARLVAIRVLSAAFALGRGRPSDRGILSTAAFSVGVGRGGVVLAVWGQFG